MANKNKLMEKAQKLLQKGKIRETIATLNQVIEVDPTDFRVLLKKSELESRVGDIDAAKESYNRVAEQYSNDGFYLKAIAIYKKILKLDADEVAIYSKLAQLYRKLGLDTEAKKHLKVVAEYYKVKGLRTNYQEIIVQLSELGETVSDSQMSMMEDFAKDGDKDRVVEQFRAMSEKFHENGNIAQLDAIVKKMDELQIKDVNVYIMQAKLYVNGKEPKKALHVIQKAYAMQPQNPLTLELLAQCFIELAQPQKAIFVYNELIKIYDRTGDMRGLSRVKSLMIKLDDPVAQLNQSEEINMDDDSGEEDPNRFQKVEQDKSEEFKINEIESIPQFKPSKPSIPNVENPLAQKSKDQTPEFKKDSKPPIIPESSISDFNSDLFDSPEDEADFERDDEAENSNNLSFMNVFVDSFDASEDTVMLDSDKDIKSRQSKSASTTNAEEEIQKTRPLEPQENLEESISFQDVSSFELVMSDTMEPTRMDDDKTMLDKPEKIISGSKTGVVKPFEDESDSSLDPSKLDLVDFEKFYSSGPQEKSEISVYEQEFVSVSDFMEEPSKSSKSKPEKVEIHDQSKPKKQAPKIQQSNLEKDALTADIQSTIDFSNINLDIPGMEAFPDEPSQNTKDIMKMMLADPEPEEVEPKAPAAAKAIEEEVEEHVHLDEKTMVDLKQEFKVNAKNEPAENSFFDLSEELKDEISEFEKSFGKSEEEPGEEEYLSPEEVILEFKKGVARTIDKNDFQTHYNLGVAYKEMGLIDEAISAFELASNNPESKADAVSMIGMCMASKGDFEGAVKLFQQILPTMSYQDPRSLGLTYQLGEAFLELGRHVDAYKAFARIKDVDPTFRDVKTRTKELAFNLGIQDQDQQQYAGKIIVDLKNRKKNKL